MEVSRREIPSQFSYGQIYTVFSTITELENGSVRNSLKVTRVNGYLKIARGHNSRNVLQIVKDECSRDPLGITQRMHREI